jgi:hypothetical protein
MQQMAHANDSKRRPEKDREHPAESRIDVSVGVKQIVDRFVDQAPERVREQNDERKRPCPVPVARQ